jgi:hypothetical protein
MKIKSGEWTKFNHPVNDGPRWKLEPDGLVWCGGWLGGSVILYTSMVPQADAGGVQDDKEHDKYDCVNPSYAVPAWCAGLKYRLARQAGVVAGMGQVSLRDLTPTVRGHAPRLEHR